VIPTVAAHAASAPVTGDAAHLAIQCSLAEPEEAEDLRETWREFTHVALASPGDQIPTSDTHRKPRR
jgi:hypothetical protein